MGGGKMQHLGNLTTTTSTCKSFPIEEDWFGRFVIGTKSEPVRRFTLTNANQMTVQVITYGATITQIKVPDKHGNLQDVVMGFSKVEDYYNHSYYFGATIGRCANRIGKGTFVVDGKRFKLNTNNGPNHLHGGVRGFDKVLWESHVEGSSVTFSYLSPDGEEGYPGAVLNHVTYTLTNDNELVVQYRATTNKTTPINLTNHSYFNLGGHGNDTIADHEVTIYADEYLPVDSDNLPTGAVVGVEGGPFDLRSPRKLSDALSSVPGGGYDHSFCFTGEWSKEERRLMARLVHAGSGRTLEVLSTQPALQFYTANFLPSDDSLVGKDKVAYHRQGAFCLETQGYPDAVNQPHFPAVLSKPGEVYSHSTVYKFGTV